MELVRSWGDKNEQLYSVREICVFGNMMIIVDCIGNQVQLFDLSISDKESGFICKWRRGHDHDDFINSSGITTSRNGVAYIIDGGANQIRAFHIYNGDFIQSWGTE